MRTAVLFPPLDPKRTPLRVTLLHNAGAGGEQHDSDALRTLVERAGHDVSYRSTKDEGWERALDEDADLVAIAGGDGTVGEVMKRLAGGPLVATVLPLGSANNIARALGIADVPIDRLVAGWTGGRRARYAVGEVASGGEPLRFVESVGGGLFAAAIARAGERDEDDKVERGLRALLELVDKLPPARWSISVDGRDRSTDAIAVEAMLVGVTGPNVPLAPRADPTDGKLDVVLVSADDRAALRRYLDGRLRGGEPDPPRFTAARGSEVVVVQPPDVQLRLDDETWSPHAAGEAIVATVGRLSVDLLLPSR